MVCPRTLTFANPRGRRRSRTAATNSRTADEFAAGITEAERLRAALIGEIELTLVPEPTRLLH